MKKNIFNTKSKIPIEHKKILDKRLKNIKMGKESFVEWEKIKLKYLQKKLNKSH